jgi:putative lipoic acid-binding regulatory protein
MTNQQPSLLEFPCDFPIKAFGHNSDDLDQIIVGIVRRHAPDLCENAVMVRASNGKRYAAITVTVRAQSQAQLDAIYTDLTASDAVIMSL